MFCYMSRHCKIFITIFRLPMYIINIKIRSESFSKVELASLFKTTALHFLLSLTKDQNQLFIFPLFYEHYYYYHVFLSNFPRLSQTSALSMKILRSPHQHIFRNNLLSCWQSEKKSQSNFYISWKNCTKKRSIID